MAVERVAVDVLGPLRSRAADGTDRTPDGALQRRLLALLVLRRGHVVTAAAAVDALWPERPPQDPVAALQNHVSRLRRCLPAEAIASTADGYRLDPAAVEVDADGLTSLLDRLATDDEPAADAEVEALLARWHGPAYPELDDLDDGRAEAARLDDLRTALVEARAERRLAAGDLDGLAAELSALVQVDPLRERPVELLMGALDASGRRAEALRAYDDLRRRLGDELGIEPSSALAARHAELLSGDPVGVRPGPLGVPRSSLPAPPSTLVGREASVADLLGALERHRVVTLVGPGGVGKTRLLLEVGHRLQDTTAVPVVLAELAPADPATAADAVAAALGIDARPGVRAAARIVDVVGGRDVVLLLDNCEHVLDPVAEVVAEVTSRCPGLRVLATSRERLRVPGEAVCRVPPLEAAGSGSAAVQLFVERARAVDPDFAPGPDDLDVVAEVVRRLDGLPLAIELAAARLHTHDVAEVAAGLDRRFAVLTGGARTSDRHGSLLAAVSWSYELLAPPLQRAFSDLSAFAGPFDVDAAAAVCDLPADEAADVLAQLTERSLLLRAPGRHAMLETLRAFGTEQLDRDGRRGAVAGRHAHHHVAWVEGAASRLCRPGGSLAEIDAALPELRSALTWLLADGDVHGAGRLVTALNDYGFFRLRPDVMAWADAVAAADPADESPCAPTVWVVSAYGAWMAGDLAGHDARAVRAVRAAGGSDAGLPPGTHPEVAVVRGNVDLFAGRLREAVRWYRRALEAAGDDAVRRVFSQATELLALGYSDDPSAATVADALLAEVGDDVTPLAAYAWYCAGEAVASRDVVRARHRHARALDLAAATGTSAITGLAGASMASIDARHGDADVAAEAYRDLIAHWRRAGMWPTQWTMLRSIADLLARRGRHREAAALEGAVRATRAGHEIFGADEVALAALGSRLRGHLGDETYDQARAEGAELDGDAAAELALAALGPTSGAAPPGSRGSPSRPARA